MVGGVGSNRGSGSSHTGARPIKKKGPVGEPDQEIVPVALFPGDKSVRNVFGHAQSLRARPMDGPSQPPANARPGQGWENLHESRQGRLLTTSLPAPSLSHALSGRCSLAVSKQ